MENNEIMKMLMEDETNDTSSTSKAKNLIANHTHRDEDISISKVRVVTAKYKIFILILIVLMIALYFVYKPEFKASYDRALSSYNNMEANLKELESKITTATSDKKLLTEIVSNENSLKNCLNNKDNQACASLKQKRHNGEGTWAELDYIVPLSFLQLQSLYSEKMSVDEKKVLRNLNEYLIKQDISGMSRDKVWEILKISIGETQEWGMIKVKDAWSDNIREIPAFFNVPVEVTIEFNTIDDLVEFLYNVEKKIIDESNDRILYKIQSVSYDIVSNDEPQITDIAMIAYYYHDDRFEWKDTQAASRRNTNKVLDPADNNENKSETKNEVKNEKNNTNKIESFFNGLFNK